MAVSIFGYARPIPREKLEAGMLISAQQVDGEWLIGIYAVLTHETGLIVLWSDKNQEFPRLEELNSRSRPSLIDGVLEIEPQAVHEAFKPVSKPVPGDEALLLEADGRLIAAVDTEFSGKSYIDLLTGKPIEGGSSVAVVRAYNAFIRQETRKERWPLITKAT